jgi:hypothetical protein
MASCINCPKPRLLPGPRPAKIFLRQVNRGPGTYF